MKAGIRISGADSLVRILRDKEARARRQAATRYEVGYSAPYAVWVHEDLNARHPVGQAKFLEQPARTMRAELSNIIRSELVSGASLAQSLRSAGERLLEESKKLVPVDTGYLRQSGYVRVI